MNCVPSGSTVITGWKPTAPPRASAARARARSSGRSGTTPGSESETQLLRKNGLTDELLPFESPGELLFLDRVGAAAVGDLELDDRLTLAEVDLLPLPLDLALGAAGEQLNGDGVSTHVAPDAADECSVVAREALRAGVDLGERDGPPSVNAVRVDRVAVAQADTAAGAAGLAQGADRAARLFDDQVDVGVAGPLDAENAVSCERLAELGLKGVVLGVTPLVL